MNLLLYFLIFLKASLLSSGGTGNLPSLHNDLVPAGVAHDRQFAEALLIGQIAPGPTGLWAVSLGYLTRGLPGGLLATVAIALPPLLILVVERLYRRVEQHPAVEGFMRGLSLAIVGVFVVVLTRLLVSFGVDVRSIAIAVIAAVLGSFRRVPLPAILVLAAGAGLLLYRP